MPNSKDLNWEPTSPGTFEVQYREEGVGDWIDYSGNPVSSPPIQIPNLIADTIYEWRVRHDCGGGEFTPWVQGPNIVMPPACSPPLFLSATVETDEILGSRVVVSWYRTIIELDPDVNVKIFYKLKDAVNFTEWTSGTLPTFNGREWTSPWSTTPGVYEWYLEMQCAGGDRPRRDGPDFTFEPPACTAVAPTGIIFVDAVSPANDYFEWPAVPGAVSYDVEIYQLMGGNFNIVTSFNTTDPNTQAWDPQADNIDPTDLVVTYEGEGCAATPQDQPPYTINSKFLVQYKPGGVLTNIPQGIPIIIQFSVDSDGATTLVYETPSQTAPGNTASLNFCVPRFNPYIANEFWDRRAFSFAPPNGFVAGNTYKVRVRSRCAYNTSDWVETQKFFPLAGCGFTLYNNLVTPKDFTSTYYATYPGHPGAVVRITFRIDRPTADPSTWVDQQIVKFNVGVSCIPASEKTVVSGPYLYQGTIKIKTDGDILFSYFWMYPTQGTFYFDGVYDVP